MKVISIEGIDCSGKSTLFKKLQEEFKDNKDFYFIKFPSVLNNHGLHAIRSIRENKDIGLEKYYLQDMELEYCKAVQQGYEYFICDRSWLSTLVYSDNPNLILEDRFKVSFGIDLNIFLDLDYSILKERLEKRSCNSCIDLKVLNSEKSYTKTRNRYLKAIKLNNVNTFTFNSPESIDINIIKDLIINL